MEKFLIIIGLSLALSLVGFTVARFCLLYMVYPDDYEVSSKKVDIVKLDTSDIPVSEELTEWDALILSLIWVESRGEFHAKNKKSSATGVLQQLNIYVDECNRISDSTKFKYSDREDPVKAIEMFELIQSKYNPEKDIDKAIRLHRGLNSRPYSNAVKAKMKEYLTMVNILNRKNNTEY